MMRTNRDRQIRHIPRGIKVISTLYILGGVLMVLTSIWLIVMCYIGLIVENNGGGKGIMAILLFPILVGINSIGTLHGLVTITAGVGLKKKKVWGLKCAYISTGLWVLIGLLIVLLFMPIIFSLGGCILSSIGALIMGISMKNWSYLDRVRHYFSDNLASHQD
jgi:hypothetical protein